MKITNRLLLIILLSACTTGIYAAEAETVKPLKQYDIEIIIFEDAHARYINSESWLQNEETDKLPVDNSEGTPQKNLDKLSLSEINATSYKNIKPVILNKDYRRVNASSEFNVLFYGAWRQTGLEETKAFEINLTELKNSHKRSSENTLSGKFRLVLARYLHIYSQLEYERKIDNAGTVTQDVNLADNTSDKLSADENIINKSTYRINSHRRMRSKETHYIDHPLVGMLIQINPVDADKEKAAEN